MKGVLGGAGVASLMVVGSGFGALTGVGETSTGGVASGTGSGTGNTSGIVRTGGLGERTGVLVPSGCTEGDIVAGAVLGVGVVVLGYVFPALTPLPTKRMRGAVVSRTCTILEMGSALLPDASETM
jgi:hypothetical protein